MKEFLKVSDVEFGDIIHNSDEWIGGAYKLIATEEGRRVTIGRVLAPDPDGILYIGKALSFKNRVIELKKSLADGYISSSHICGRRYKARKKIMERFPYPSLFIELIPDISPSECEKKLLKNYLEQFGEAPPLNVFDC